MNAVSSGAPARPEGRRARVFGGTDAPLPALQHRAAGQCDVAELDLDDPAELGLDGLACRFVYPARGTEASSPALYLAGIGPVIDDHGRDTGREIDRQSGVRAIDQHPVALPVGAAPDRRSPPQFIEGEGNRKPAQIPATPDRAGLPVGPCLMRRGPPQGASVDLVGSGKGKPGRVGQDLSAERRAEGFGGINQARHQSEALIT